MRPPQQWPKRGQSEWAAPLIELELVVYRQQQHLHELQRDFVTLHDDHQKLSCEVKALRLCLCTKKLVGAADVRAVAQRNLKTAALEQALRTPQVAVQFARCTGEAQLNRLAAASHAHAEILRRLANTGGVPRETIPPQLTPNDSGSEDCSCYSIEEDAEDASASPDFKGESLKDDCRPRPLPEAPEEALRALTEKEKTRRMLSQLQQFPAWMRLDNQDAEARYEPGVARRAVRFDLQPDVSTFETSSEEEDSDELPPLEDQEDDVASRSLEEAEVSLKTASLKKVTLKKVSLKKVSLKTVSLGNLVPVLSESTGAEDSSTEDLRDDNEDEEDEEDDEDDEDEEGMRAENGAEVQAEDEPEQLQLDSPPSRRPNLSVLHCADAVNRLPWDHPPLPSYLGISRLRPMAWTQHDWTGPPAPVGVDDFIIPCVQDFMHGSHVGPELGTGKEDEESDADINDADEESEADDAEEECEQGQARSLEAFSTEGSEEEDEAGCRLFGREGPGSSDAHPCWASEFTSWQSLAGRT